MTIRTLRHGLMAWLLLAAAACTEELTPPSGSTATGGRKATVRLSVTAAPISAGMKGTRALPEDIDEGTAGDYTVKDFWLMEFDNVGNLIGTPQYYTKEKLTDGNMAIPIILPADNATEYKCVVVANTHTENFVEAIGEVDKLATLRQLGRKITRQEDLYNIGSNDLLMNCVMTVRNDTRELDCQLYRNIAKLTLRLTNKRGSKVRINTVQLCNVTGHMFYADRLYDGAPAPSPTTAEASFTSWEVEKAAIDEDEVQTFTYYLPRNCRGNTTGTLPSQKNKDAPDYATYIEIMAEDKDSGTPVRYRFYPGENMTNNFDIVPNRHYILPITIEGKGDAGTDSRVEDMGTLNLPESNCYIVNPLSGGVQQLYEVTISRINKFWGSDDGKIATDDSGLPEDNTINGNTKWVAEVIWQDADRRLINFCDENGNILTGDTYTGIGNSYFRFKPVEGARGNVLVGVRKESANKESYLWSWHLWITDYKPEYTTAWREGVYVYLVEGGHVHRYAGNSTGNNVWDTKYCNKYIMDRNLGALAAGKSDYEGSRGFYYQFGRKDPFPPGTALYDINGKPQKVFTASDGDCIERISGKVYLYMGVKRPYSFYYPGSDDWVRENPYSSNSRLWNNPTWHSDEDKSLFDPCPPGWRLPLNGTWSNFATTIDGADFKPNAKEYFESTGFESGWNFYMGGLATGETTWYPASGLRSINSGVTSVGNGYYWSASSIQVKFAYNLFFSSVYASWHSSSQRGCGFPVRCVQEE